MTEGRFIDTLGIVIGCGTLIASFIIFFSDTKEFGGSLVAAMMTAALIWGTYIIIKWLLLANKS